MSEKSNDMTTPQEPIPAQASEPIAPATPLPASSEPAAKGNGIRTAVIAGASALVGAVLVLGAGAIGYSIGNHDSDNHREATLTVSGDRNGQQEGGQGEGPRMGHDDEYGMHDQDGMMQGPGGMDQRGIDPDGDNWSGQNRDGGMMGGGQGDGPMMQGPGGMMNGLGNGPAMGGGIQDFLNQLQSGEGLTPDQQQFLDQLKGFVGGMRNQMG